MGVAGGQTLSRAKLSTRLALIVAACVLAAATAFAVLASLQISGNEYRLLDGSLRDQAQQIADGILRGDDAQQIGFDVDVERNIWQVWGQTNERAPFKRQGGYPKSVKASNLEPEFAPGVGQDVTYAGRPFRTYALEISETAVPGLRPTTVRVGRFSGDTRTRIASARTKLFTGAGLASALAVLTALLAARRGLRPLDTVQTAAEYVADNEDLGVRIEEDGPPEVRGLAASVNRMLSRLAGSQHRLEVALEEQRRFAQDASHELRTPLTAIRGHLDILDRYKVPDEEREAILGEMSEATDRMKRLVEGLLALARTEGRPGPGEGVSVAETLREIAGSEGEGPFIEDDDDLVVVGDREQIRGIFTNLVDNGRRYGGNVEIRARREGDFAVVEVEDDGPGIPAEDRERVFDRFYRAPGLRSTPGSGLGLAIARQATLRMGGSLQLIDGDRGARFEVRLPIATAPTEPPEPPPGVAPVGDYDDEL